MEKPTVIWKKTITPNLASHCVRAVRIETPGVLRTDPTRAVVAFEFLSGIDSMGEGSWLPLHKLQQAIVPQVDYAAKDAFIIDASASMVENPVIEEE